MAASKTEASAAQNHEKALLWRLRQILKDQHQEIISFARLVNDLDFRIEIIKRTRLYNSPELNKVIEELQRASGISTTSAVKIAAAQAKAAESHKNRHNYNTMRGVAMAFTLISAAGAGLGFLASFGVFQQVALDQAGTPEASAGETLTVSGSILENTLWRAKNTYMLEGLVFVEAGAALTLEAGTQILGKPGSALIVTRDAKIYARGSATQPIVFTSAQKLGERKRGDWGGLVMLGTAPVNRKKDLNDPNEVGSAHIEGIAETDNRGRFGGNNHNHNCGLLEYVRIEFAGFKIAANNELNGLTLGGCGQQTVVNYIQSHRGADDGIELFGGNVDLRHVVITGADDDGLDWDMGWQGRVQFMVIQQYADGGDAGIEADNWKKHPDAQPRSQPIIYNATLLGSRDLSKDQRAAVFRLGTGITLRNSIIAGFPQEGIDIRDKETAALFKTGVSSFDGLIIHDIKSRTGSETAAYFPAEEGDKDDDGGFNEAAYFNTPKRARFMEPGLSRAAYDLAQPNFTPVGSATLTYVAPIPTETGEAMEFWHESTDFIGAVRPDAGKTWLEGWTAFPLN
jgi:hypothetical protein